MEQIIDFISGIVLSWVVQGAKKVEAIPINEGEKAKIRTVISVLSIAVSFGNAYLNGNLHDEALWKPLIGAGLAFAASHINYAAFFKKDI